MGPSHSPHRLTRHQRQERRKAWSIVLVTSLMVAGMCAIIV
jgi:hypothetical protein